MASVVHLSAPIIRRNRPGTRAEVCSNLLLILFQSFVNFGVVSNRLLLYKTVYISLDFKQGYKTVKAELIFNYLQQNTGITHLFSSIPNPSPNHIFW